MLRLTALPLALLCACTAPAETREVQPDGRYSAVGVLDADQRNFIVIGGDGPRGVVDDVLSFSLQSRRWTQRTPWPETTVRGTAVRHGEDIWVFGGSTRGWGELATLHRFGPNTDDSPETLPAREPWPAARYKHAAVLAGDTMWVLGGKNNDGDEPVIHSDLWAWDVRERSWHLQPTDEGPGGIYRQGMVHDAARDVLWIHGGYDQEEQRRDWLWKLDLQTARWERVTWEGEGPGRRASHTLAMLDRGPAAPEGDGVLLWGGHDHDVELWLFDIEARRWRVLPNAGPASPTARDAQVAEITADGRELLVLCGDVLDGSPSGPVCDAWKFEFEISSWQRLANTLVP